MLVARMIFIYRAYRLHVNTKSIFYPPHYSRSHNLLLKKKWRRRIRGKKLNWKCVFRRLTDKCVEYITSPMFQLGKVNLIWKTCSEGERKEAITLFPIFFMTWHCTPLKCNDGKTMFYKEGKLAMVQFFNKAQHWAIYDGDGGVRRWWW